MIIQSYNDTKRIVIGPGEYFVSTRQEVISTLLGSCIAACLYDESANIIGMNHFMLAYKHPTYRVSTMGSREGKYGIISMELLINKMVALGANRSNLKAKCFGGGEIIKTVAKEKENQRIGALNIEFIRDFLSSEKIPIVNSALGGNHGRTIHFLGRNFSVYVRDIGQLETHKVEQIERNYWQKNITKYQLDKLKTLTLPLAHRGTL